MILRYPDPYARVLGVYTILCPRFARKARCHKEPIYNLGGPDMVPTPAGLLARTYFLKAAISGKRKLGDSFSNQMPSKKQINYEFLKGLFLTIIR